MGAGIAQVTLDKGIKTIMKDANDAGITRGIHQVQTGVDGKVKRKKISRYVFSIIFILYLKTNYLTSILGSMEKKLCQVSSPPQATTSLIN